MVGSVLVATPGSVHSAFIELQLLIIPQHQIHIKSISLLDLYYPGAINRLKRSLRLRLSLSSLKETGDFYTLTLNLTLNLTLTLTLVGVAIPTALRGLA